MSSKRWLIIPVAVLAIAAGVWFYVRPSSSSSASEDATIEKMRKIVIPEISFQNEDIRDVIAILEKMSYEYGDPNVPYSRRGIHLVLDLRSRRPDESEAKVPPVTFKASEVDFYEILQVITEISGLEFRIVGGNVVIVPQIIAC